jgi:hypothetical protein
LNHILELDLNGDGIPGSPNEKPTITVEPGVTHGMITDLLLPMGYALEVQVEMENITIGGNAMGLGMETNSHLYGLFQETVTRYEMVSASGKVHDVTEENDPEFFHALPWSHGSLGFLTAVTVGSLSLSLSFTRIHTLIHSNIHSHTGTTNENQTVCSRKIRSNKYQGRTWTLDETLRRAEKR